MKHYSESILNYINQFITIEGVSKEISSHFWFDPESIEIKNLPIVIECFGITNPDPKYSVKRDNRPNFILEYIVEGEGIVNVEGNEFKVKAGDSYILFPYTKQEYKSDPKNPFKKYWVNFRGDVIYNIIKSMGLLNKNHYPETDLNSYFLSLFSMDGDSLLSKDVAYVVFPIIMNMLLKLHKKKDKDDTYIPSTIKKARKILGKSLDDKIEIQDVCKELGITKSYLDREFKKYYNETPSHYRNKKRLEIVCAYLVNTDTSIQLIAEKFHFSDVYHLSHTFKKEYNISPIKYRKLYRFKSYSS